MLFRTCMSQGKPCESRKRGEQRPTEAGATTTRANG